MAVTILTVDNKTITINGKSYQRIYLPLRVSTDSIAIYSLYDTRLQILGATPYTEFTVNGSTFASQELAMVALNSVLFKDPNAVTQGVIAFRDTTENTVSAGSEQTGLGLVTLPANTLDTLGQGLRIVYSGQVDRASGTPSIKLYIGANLMITHNISGWTGTGSWSIIVEMTYSASGELRYTAQAMAVGTNQLVTQGAIPALDFTADIDFTISYTGISADDLSIVNSNIIKV